jgi:sortase A
MKKLPIILLITGILIASIPLVGQLYAKYQEDRMMEEWLNSIDADDAEDTDVLDPEEAYAMLQEAFGADDDQDRDADNNPDDSDGLDTADNTEGNEPDQDISAGQAGGSGSSSSSSSGSSASSGSKAPEQKVLGIIQIKKIKVKEPIVEGVSKTNLKAGIGHIPGTAGLGQPGNCALAGHRNYAFKKFFRRLDELEAGDEILITTKSEDLTYKVTGKVIVEPDDVSVLAGTKDKNIVTLITCTPVYVASHRLIVTAELTDRVLKEP